MKSLTFWCLCFHKDSCAELKNEDQHRYEWFVVDAGNRKNKKTKAHTLVVKRKLKILPRVIFFCQKIFNITMAEMALEIDS